ncbi:membrane metalloprotease [Polaribacter undariae]|uniref:Membrane metalloprotease n=2 Tax=Polaribacter sejongensis TaxID=985043 RepID=A0AAJ1QUC8_9FLAO|nr:membrane metalloprotease [Polaribacter undariae]MDN3618197.1 membrane metalloprotease [Polaribacter undariae]UWD30815.1 membrane metalloprotease [Polaribacter undariae]
MKNILLKVILVCSILFSCSSKEDEIIDSETGNLINVSTNRQITGSSANDLLSGGIFKKMIVEIAYIEGFKPSETAINNFKNFITSRTNKPEGVTYITQEISFTDKEAYTLEEVVALEKEHRTKYSSDTTITLWVLFVNGKSSKDTSSSAILGAAYWNTSFVIYEETLHGLSNGAFEPERSLLESSVINHEFGHLLGLTNLGSELQSNHEDTEHPKHCIEEDCLMYWAAETSQGIGSMLSGGQVPTLDAQCLEDLKANGGK